LEEFFFICRNYISEIRFKANKKTVGDKVRKEIFINLEKEIFRGNILDVGLDNYGVVYNIYKQYHDNVNVEYISGKEEVESLKEEFYDSCILFFSFSSIWLRINKRKFIRDIYRYLNKDGLLYIWDIDKGYTKVFNATVKIVIPEGKLRQIKLRDLNVFKDTSKQNTIKMLEEYFNIIDVKSSDGIYYIKARKKALEQKSTSAKIREKGIEEKNESSINSA
jgi:hypothetical protein